MSDPIRVLVVDDHPIVREGVQAMLGQYPDLRVVGEARNGIEALQRYAELVPDVVLLDLGLPGMDGLEVIRRLRTDWPQARIVVFSSLDGDESIRRALEAGASNYVLKDMRGPELLQALRRAGAGARQLSEAAAARLSEAGPVSRISPRELEVLQLIAEGLSNRGIGERLGIGEGTVKTHVLQILDKLDASDRTAAVVQALRRGIITLQR